MDILFVIAVIGFSIIQKLVKASNEKAEVVEPQKRATKPKSSLKKLLNDIVGEFTDDIVQ